MPRLLALFVGALVSCAALAQEASDPRIERAWARATSASARNGGVFMTITGTREDRLVAARTPVAGRVELHTHAMDHGVMRMRAVEGGIPIAPGQATELKPGGPHVMLMGLERPLREGESFPLELSFEHAGARTVIVTVGKAGAMEHPGGH